MVPKDLVCFIYVLFDYAIIGYLGRISSVDPGPCKKWRIMHLGGGMHLRGFDCKSIHTSMPKIWLFIWRYLTDHKFSPLLNSSGSRTSPSRKTWEQSSYRD